MADPLTTLILNLKDIGFPLVLLWLLTLAIVYGILSHVEIPRSMTARGVISIVTAFLVLFAAAGGAATTFIENLVVTSIVIAIGLLITVIFVELLGIKSGEHLFAKYPQVFGIAIIALVILIFVGAGGLSIVNIPDISIGATALALLFFFGVMAVAVWVLMKENK